MPTTWPELYAQVDRLDLSQRHFNRARAEFEAWAEGTELRALELAHAAATLRAHELYERTGLRVVVEPLATGKDRGPWKRVTLLVGATRADLYSVREPGSAPSLHLGVQRAATSTRSPVFATVPGVLLVRRGLDAFDALCLPLPADAPECRKTTMDGLVLRLFELLLGAHRSAHSSAT